MNSYIFTIDDRNDFLRKIALNYLQNSRIKTGSNILLNIGELVIDKFSDDFTFTKAEDTNTFYKLIRKDESSFDESYVH